MGRIPGVTAAETRERLLRAAADVFAERGYDGTRVADIASAAGVSNGALYAHFASKAQLLVGALQTHGRRLLAEAFAADPDRSVTDVLLLIGRYVPVALVILGPIIVNILLFHITLAPIGITPGLICAVLEIFLIWAYWPAFRAIFTAKMDVG